MEKYPEYKKLDGIVNISQPLGEFLEWLQGEKNFIIAHYPILDNGEESVRLSPAFART